MDEELSQQPWRDQLWRVFKKAAGQQAASQHSAFPSLRIETSTPQTRICLWGPRTWGTQRGGLTGPLSSYLCAFCHSFTSLSTSSA